MPSREIVFLSFALCLSAGFQQGYIASVLNQSYREIQQFINETITERFSVQIHQETLKLTWSLLNVMFPVATIFGQFLAAWMCRHLGRRKTAIISCATYIPGTVLSALALPFRSFELLFVGRLIWSLANGVQSVNATVWIVESAPQSIRGASAALQEVSMAIGSLLSAVVAVPVSTPTLWPIVFLPNVPIAMIAIAICIWLPDSPTSIIERKGNHLLARESLARYHGVHRDSKNIDEEMMLHHKKPTTKTGTADKVNDKSIWWVFNPFASADDRSLVAREAAWLGVMVKIAYVFTGARALRAYSTFVVHEMSGFSLIHSQYSSVAVSILRIPFTLIPVFFVDRIGRRPLLLVSQIMTVLSLCVLMASIVLGSQFQFVSLGAFFMILLVNAAGLGSISRFYGAELVPRSMLLSSMTILTALEAATKIVVEFFFYPLANSIKVYSFLMFLVPSLIFLLIIYTRCPETSNRSVHEVLNAIAIRKKLYSMIPPNAECDTPKSDNSNSTQ